MKITNKYNLPEPIVRAIERHEHKGADYSATQLLKSPRQLWLERRHDNEIEVDATEMLWSLQGTAMHKVVEAGEAAHQFSETYMVEKIDGVSISGTADLYDAENKTISDYKNTSVWTIIYGSRKKEWTQQLNIYAYLMRRAGFEVKKLEVVAMLRDWQKKQALKHGYPSAQVAVVPLDLWSDADAEWFIRSRLELIESAKDLPDNQLPLCTDEERWKTEDTYAVKKDGVKKAVKLYDNMNDAENHATRLGPKHFVEQRTGEARRCQDYCPVSHLCNQYQSEVER